jgi:hypothetical protein
MLNNSKPILRLIRWSPGEQQSIAFTCTDAEGASDGTVGARVPTTNMPAPTPKHREGFGAGQ